MEASCCGGSVLLRPRSVLAIACSGTTVPYFRGIGWVWGITAVAACLCAGSEGARGTKNELEPSKTCFKLSQVRPMAVLKTTVVFFLPLNCRLLLELLSGPFFFLLFPLAVWQEVL